MCGFEIRSVGWTKKCMTEERMSEPMWLNGEQADSFSEYIVKIKKAKKVKGR
jgi:hypothetical protein